MKKRLLAIVLTLAMLFTMLPGMSMTASAEETTTDPTVWDGSIDTSWYDSTKTEFTITTAAQLAGLAKITSPDRSIYTEWTAGTSKASEASGIDVDTFLGKTVKLGADIDLGGYTADGTKALRWDPIADTNNWGEGGQGTSNGTFDNTYWQGTFDGCGHTISNIRIDGSDECAQNFGGYQGFISAIGEYGIVKNLGISSGTLYGRVCGGIVSYAPISAPASVSTWPKIMNCWTNLTITGNGSSSRPSGGIFGGQGERNDWVCIINCYVRGTTSNGMSQGGVGGFVNGVVAGCYNTGKVATTSGSTGYGGAVVATLESIIQGSSTKVIVKELGDNTKLQEGLFVNNMALTGTHANFFRFGGASSGPYNAVTTGFSTEAELKAGASVLGSGYTSDSTDESINDGYPVLFWQTGQKEVSIAGASVEPIPDQKYSASEVQPFPVVKLNGQTLTYGTDYLVQWEDNIQPGTAKLTVIGVGRYTGTLEPVNFTILDIDWSGVTVEKPTDRWIYDEPVTPSLTVKDAEGNTLEKGKEYNVVWTDNDKAGTATATIMNLAGTTTGPSTTFDLYQASTSLQGSGTQTDPYLISDRYDLQFLAHKVNTVDENYRTAYYKLTQDICLDPTGDEPENDPIGIQASVINETSGSTSNYYAPFAGTFDGDGHKITINWEDRERTAAIGNRECTKVNTLALFGFVGSLTNEENNLSIDWNTTVNIKNLTVDGKISDSIGSGASYAAAVVGRISNCQFFMSNVVNNADVITTATSNTPQIGGIIANSEADSTLSNVTNNGTVSSQKTNAGGIFANLSISSSTSYGPEGKHFASLTNVINNGDITSKTSKAGGIAGNSTSSSTSTLDMKECANTGNITGGSDVAGLMPSMPSSGASGTWTITACCNSGNVSTTATGGTTICAGGLLAYAPYGALNITDCYNSGDITNPTTAAFSSTAGLVASDRGATSVKGDRTISGCYNSGTINATNNVGAFIGYSRAGALSGKATTSSPYINTTISGMYVDTCQNAIGVNFEVGGTVTNNAEKKTEAELKAAAEALGTSYRSDLTGSSAINGGYPLLYWQIKASSTNIICRNYGSDYNIVMYAADDVPGAGNAYFVDGIESPMKYVADYTTIFTGTEYDEIFSGKKVFAILVPSTKITPEDEGSISVIEASGNYTNWENDSEIVCASTGIGHNYDAWVQSGNTFTRTCSSCSKTVSFDFDLTKTEASSIANVTTEGDDLTFEISGLGSDEMVIAAAENGDGQSSSASEAVLVADGRYKAAFKSCMSIVTRKIGDADGNGILSSADAGMMLLASTGAVTLTGVNETAVSAIAAASTDAGYTERALMLLTYMSGGCSALR